MRNPVRYLLGALALTVACSNAGDKLVTPPLPTGGIGVAVYFDRDGTGTFTVGDTFYVGARIALLPADGRDTLMVATTDTLGVAIFDSIGVGTYQIAIDRAHLPDSVGVAVGDTGTIRVLARADSNHPVRVLRMGYRQVGITDARSLPAGARVQVRGIVTSPFQAFHDSSAFITDGQHNLRITHGTHVGGRSGNNLGDSVIVLGTIGADRGQPVLLNGVFATLAERPAPVATTISVADANTASGGTLDAALVQLSGAFVADTAAIGPDFLVHVLDPADSSRITSVLVDSLLGAPHALWVPGVKFTFRGVLVPKGDGTWYLKPRAAFDIGLAN